MALPVVAVTVSSNRVIKGASDVHSTAVPGNLEDLIKVLVDPAPDLPSDLSIETKNATLFTTSFTIIKLNVLDVRPRPRCKTYIVLP